MNVQKVLGDNIINMMKDNIKQRFEDIANSGYAFMKNKFHFLFFFEEDLIPINGLSELKFEDLQDLSVVSRPSLLQNC